MLQLDLQQIVSQAISFILLVVILKRFAWKPLLAILDARRARIEEDLRQVAQSKAELARLQQEYGKRLAAIEDEARTKIQQAVLEGKRVAVEIQEQAREQGHALLRKTKDTVELEVAKAKVTLRDELISLTLSALERILQRTLDERTDRRLVESVLAELEQGTAPR